MIRSIARRWRARTAVILAMLTLLGTGVATPASAATLFRTDLSFEVTSFNVAGRQVSLTVRVRNEGPQPLTDPWHFSTFVNLASYNLSAPGVCSRGVTDQFVDCEQPPIQQVGGTRTLAITYNFTSNCAAQCNIDLYPTDLRFRQAVDLDESNDAWQIRDGRELLQCNDPPFFACLDL